MKRLLLIVLLFAPRVAAAQAPVWYSTDGNCYGSGCPVHAYDLEVERIRVSVANAHEMEKLNAEKLWDTLQELIAVVGMCSVVLVGIHVLGKRDKQ